MYANSPPPSNASSQLQVASFGPESDKVWHDTSAEDVYGSYLEGTADHHQLRPTMAAKTHNPQTHQDITVGILDDETPLKKQTFSGRKRVWPGALLLLLIALGAFAAIAYGGYKQYLTAQDEVGKTEAIYGVPGQTRKTPIPAKVCQVPNYIAKEGSLYAELGDKKVPIRFTGINWSGMENKEGVPHGMAYGQSNLDDIAKKLKAQGLNSVRLPLNAKGIIKDTAPSIKSFVNAPQNPDLANTATYLQMIERVVQGLAKQQIAVLLDIHKLDPEYKDDTSEHHWFSDDYPQATMLTDVYGRLATRLCNNNNYNIIGIDLKNEPVGMCWPAKDTDTYCDPVYNWPRAVEKIAKVILEACPQWLIVVEGLYAQQIVVEIGGKTVTYNDWYGASFQNSTKNPINLPVDHKLVYAPHFYSPSVYPADYFFASVGTQPKAEDKTRTEYPDTPEGTAALKKVLYKVMDTAFGDAIALSGVPTFYGEFGGIYGENEKLVGKTSTRAINIFIEYAEEKKMIGGMSWSLNPDSAYSFNDVYKKDGFQFGLYADSKWKTYNEDYSTGLQALKGNGVISCFNVTSSSGTSKPTSKPPTATTVTPGVITNAPVNPPTPTAAPPTVPPAPTTAAPVPIP